MNFEAFAYLCRLPEESLCPVDNFSLIWVPFINDSANLFHAPDSRFISPCLGAMAILLRSIVAGPRLRNSEARLDLCYVTDNIIATSGPSSTYPKRAYRNPTDTLVKFLDSKHGEGWAIWEFRAEGTGYPDSEVYGRIRHYPWPDHHPPPFALIPNIVASMRNWLHDKDTDKVGRVVVVHCKAGKGRSGTAVCSYLISEESWESEDALARFTARRMRPGFGAGISIPSQLRWVGYVDRWTKTGKRYVERQVEVLELHVWGLRDGVKVAIQGYVSEGRAIKTFHVFDQKERLIVDGTASNGGTSADVVGVTKTSNDIKNIAGSSNQSGHTTEHPRSLTDPNQLPSQLLSEASAASPDISEPGGKAVIFRPIARVVLPTSDICIDFERRNRATYRWALVTAVAHVWFNAYFEGLTSSTDPQSAPNGVFKIEWDAMDGIKGSSRKGIRALDHLAVVWRALGEDEDAETKLVKEPAMGEEVPQMRPADWKKQNESTADDGRDLGVRAEPIWDKTDGAGKSSPLPQS